MQEIRNPSAPAALALLFYVAGLLSARILVDPFCALWGLGGVAALLLCTRWRRRLPAALFLLVAVLGIVRGTGEREGREREAQWYRGLPSGRFVTIEIELEDDWQPRHDGSYRMRARSFAVLEGDDRKLFRRTIYISTRSVAPPVWDAETLRLEGFLRRLERGDYALSVKSSRLVEPEGRASRWDPRLWNRFLVQKLSEVARSSAGAQKGAAITQALVLGKSERLAAEDLEVYQRGGTYHLLVFSGLQIGMMAGMIGLLLRAAGATKLADLTLVLVCALAPPFIGGDPSVSRSAWMIGVFALSRLWKRPVSIENLLFVSALVRLVAHPSEIESAGFALTYAATGGILLIGKPLARLMKTRSKLFSTLSWGIAAELATTCLTAHFFHRVVLGSSLVTIVVGPFMLVMLILGVFATALAPAWPEPAWLMLEAIASTNEVTMAINRMAADGLGLSIPTLAPPGLLIAAVFVVVTALAGWGRRGGWIWMGGVLLLPLLYSVMVSARLAAVTLPTMEALDVGQGDAILLRTHRSVVLVDGGGSRLNPSFGQRVLLPLLVDRGVRRLDAVALSHPHPDHCGGLPAVIRELEVGEVWLRLSHLATPCGADIVDAALVRGVPIVGVDRYPVLRGGDIVLQRMVSHFRFKKSLENNSSVMFLTRLGKRRILLTGDVEREAERDLVEEMAGGLQADVLKVAHHGSHSSSTERFLDQVGARIAIVSCGRENLFGHPHSSVLERLRETGVRTERTDESGSIHLTIDGTKIYTTREIDTTTGSF